MQATTPSPTRTREPDAVTMCSQDLMALLHTTLINTPKYATCYITTLVDNNFNSTKVLDDCAIPDCFSWLSENKVAAVSNPGLNCYMYDMVTKKAFPSGNAVNFCFPQTTTTTLPPPGTIAPTPSTTTATPSATVATGPSSSSSPSMVGGVVGGAVGLVLILGIAWWCCRRRSKRDDHQAGQSSFNRVGSPMEVPPVTKPAKDAGGSHHNPTTNASSTSSSKQHFLLSSNDISLSHGIVGDLQQLEIHRIAFTDVHMIQPVAEGAFGQVWLGSFMGQRVAIKKLLPRKATAEDLAQFIKEILLVSRFECPYVVAFVGAAWHKPVDMVLVTEFMDRGDLRGVLQANAAKADKTFTWRDKVECALSIAEGLVYLHSMDPVVIHRDLKSRNVLLDSTRGCKITDFGIARETYDQTLTLNAGTYRWMAPEVVQDGHYSQSADLFSFGVILSELDTEQLPYANQRNDRGNPFTDLRLMEAVAKGRILPAFTAACPAWFQELGVQCMALDPTQRPSATQVSFVLRGHVQRLAEASEETNSASGRGYFM